ncbi:hypothetical protein HMPREF0072_0532 [Anaerococcus lactolyticus ATCC 51172]|uniref:Uncharacterized protein n=1 Tax=Anaerococcus lactolyticus ATCC 51172 TaxID=525254 RepID=C2BDW2_9FIRM|nr:hypothetical protein [Anaerococcus lactolyticus]EEI86977.1 hypothetical protein HMPREF0072_0532 [Anaerococcus lactolyticus ATCC 51172]
MDNNLDIEYKIIPYDDKSKIEEFDLDEIIFDLDSELDLLESKADKLDYLIAIASGLICGMLDILWVKDFDFARGRELANNKVEGFVKKTAELVEGKKFENLGDAVRALEKRFPIPADGNTIDFGGGLQHHLRDFAHHPTIAGLSFSLLTQFTEKSYGTDVTGKFIIFDVAENSKAFIGDNLGEKLIKGTLTWFFHLVSDMAGSSVTAGLSGGTGIPGPILSLAKEISVLPFFNKINIKDDMSLSVFLSKLFNGTLLMKRDEKGQIIKDSVYRFDLRAEFGIALELGKQAVPVLANECIVRGFYFIRHFALAMKEIKVSSFKDMRKIDWNLVKPVDNPTISRMLTISTGVFTGLDLGEAILTQKYWLSINYVGVGRFALAISTDLSYGLKKRNLKKIRTAYEKIQRQTLINPTNQEMGVKPSGDMNKLGLSLEQAEILFNIEYLIVLNDIENTNNFIVRGKAFDLKIKWLAEWKQIITKKFETFTQVPGAVMNWYSQDKLEEKIIKLNPTKAWFRLVLLESMLFEPYYPLKAVKNKKDKYVLSKRYNSLNNPINRFNKEKASLFLNEQFTGMYCEEGYVDRLRKSFNKQIRNLNLFFKLDIKKLSQISGIAAIGFLGFGFTGALTAVVVQGKKSAIIEAAKLLTSIREIFLDDDKDLEFSIKVLEKYTESITKIEKNLVDLRLKRGSLDSKEKSDNEKQIKNLEENVVVMKIARKIMIKMNNEFKY